MVAVLPDGLFFPPLRRPPLGPRYLSQTFDGVVIFDTKFSPEVSHIAEELQSLVVRSTSDGDLARSAGSSSAAETPHSAGSSSATMRPLMEAVRSSCNTSTVNAVNAASAAGPSLLGVARVPESPSSRFATVSFPTDRASNATTSSDVSSDLIRVQLQDLLYKVWLC